MRHSFSANVRYLLSKLFDNVPHACIIQADWTEPGAWPHFSARLRVQGWGPSLHEATYDARKDFVSEDELLAGILEFAAEIGGEQVLLAEIAAKAGITRPMPHPCTNDPVRQVTTADVAGVAHLWIERVLIDALIQADGVNGAAIAIIHSLDNLLRSSQTEGLCLRASGDLVELRGERCVFERTHMIGGPMLASLHGRMLDLRARIPETVLDAAIGKPLSILVETRIPSLDAASLESTTTYSDAGLQLRVQSDLVRIGDHPGLAEGFANLIAQDQIKDAA